MEYKSLFLVDLAPSLLMSMIVPWQLYRRSKNGRISYNPSKSDWCKTETIFIQRTKSYHVTLAKYVLLVDGLKSGVSAD